MPDNTSFPCEFCEKKCKTANDLRYHLEGHSYKRTNYWCNDCDFVGKQPISIEVDLGKYHSDKFECGLCMCYDCDKRFKGLSDI